MIRVQHLEKAGAACAVISDLSDGDCARNGAGRNGFLRCLGLNPNAVAAPVQVHGSRVLAVNDGAPPGEADALVTNVRGLPLGITVADCVPVLLYDPARTAGAAIHAGRAGTEANIAAAAVGALAEGYGCAAAEILAVIGPSAGPCCYEVSPELAENFARLGLPVQGRKLDLWAANRQQLEGAGVLPENIRVHGPCTICGEGFHSYRSGHQTERNLAVLVL